MVKHIKIIFLVILAQNLNSQEVLFPVDSNSQYVFFKGQNGNPSIFTLKGVYTYSDKWKYQPITLDSSKTNSLILKSKQKFNNETLISFTRNKNTFFVLNGGGYVFKLADNKLSREDNSVLQKNQFNSAVFYHKNQIHMHGGYGFWSFKNYTTFLDNDTGQWELVYPKSKFLPIARWKMISNLIGDKFFVLGGRGNLTENYRKDALLNSHYFFDLGKKKYVDLGQINPKLPLKNNIQSSLIIENKKAFIEPHRVIFFDFKNDTVQIYKNKNLFKGIDINKPVVKFNDTIYYLKNKKDEIVLAKQSLESIYKGELTELQISIPNKSGFSNIIGMILVIIFCWVAYKLFVFKDFLKGLVLYDETRIYYEDKSTLMSPRQILVIKELEREGQLSSSSLNKIISKKKFVKSHFTALRTEFVKEINLIYKNVTSTQSDLVEEVMDPSDKRYKVYKITQQVSEKESFFSFLFKL